MGASGDGGFWAGRLPVVLGATCSCSGVEPAVNGCLEHVAQAWIYRDASASREPTPLITDEHAGES